MKKKLLVLSFISLSLFGFAQEIQFEKTIHDFGQMYLNCPKSYDFVFTNTGKEPLILSQVRAKGVSLIWDKTPVNPGGKGKVTVTHKAKKFGKISTTTITVFSNAKNSGTVVLRLTGEVHDNLSKRNGKWGSENCEGQVIIPFQYDELVSHGNEVLHSNGTIIVGPPSELGAKKSGKWGIIDRNNKTIIPFEYDGVAKKDHGIYNAKKNGKWGLINPNNMVIIPFEYEAELQILDDGFVKAKKNNNWGIIGADNTVIIPFEYDDFSSSGFKNQGYGNDEKTIEAKKRGKWGIVSQNNRVVIPFQYDEFGSFYKNGRAAQRKGYWCIIDKNNNVIVPFENTLESLEFLESFSN